MTNAQEFAALRRSEANLQAIFEHSSEGFMLTDVDGRVITLNNKSKDTIFLYAQQEIRVGDSIYDFIHPFRRQEYREMMKQVLAGETRQYDFPSAGHDGQTRWFHFSVNPVYRSGTVAGFSITSADITERKEVEDSLVSSRSNLEAIIENTDASIYSLDKNLRYVIFNKRHQSILLGLFGAEIREGDDVREVLENFGSAGAKEWLDVFSRALRGETVKFEMEFTVNNAHFCYSYSIYPILENNDVVGISSFAENISLQREAEREKKNLEELLTKANKLALMGNWELNLENDKLFWSPMVKQIFEVTPEFIPSLERGLSFFKPGTNRDSLDRAINDAIGKAVAYDLEAEIVTAKGHERWVRMIGESEWRDEKCIRLYGSIQDIDSRKRAEIEFVKVYNEKNTILESIGDAFFAVDKHWMISYWNRKAESTFEVSRQDLLGKNLWKVFEDAIGSESYVQYLHAMATNQAVHFEEQNTRLKKWFEISAYPSANGLSVYLKDITRRKSSELKLSELNVDLQRQAKELVVINKDLEQFAYVASHDLQEPLRMVTGFLTQIEKKYGDKLDEKGKQYIDFAVDGAQRMRQIILDLLEFSRIGRLEEEPENIDLNSLLKEILWVYKKQIEQTKAVVSYKNLPTIINNKTPLRQVFQNLVSNALKYQKPGTIPVVTITSEEQPTGWLFTIQDNGIGIQPQYFEKIFTIFQRLHAKEEYSGTGMGLAICKKIIENLGGKIWVESVEGQGSSFYFTLPKNSPS